MRIDEVRADAFGPLPSGARLQLAPGLTVVWGGNEAGKSSWHGALFAGLCGQRRGPGKTVRQRELEQAHRPWSGSAWRAGTTVTLADGRVLVLRHDLDSPDRSRVTDRDTGEDLTGGLIEDGGPDGAVLLGLNRRTLPHTIMVRQADLLACTDAADELQHMLQRAAATAGDAATADEAIRQIERVRAEAVGTEQAPTRPLARELSALSQAESDLEAARADHAEYARLRARHEEAAAATGRAEQRLAQLDAELARRQAAALGERVGQAQRLVQRVPAWVVEEVEATARADDGGADDGDVEDPESVLADEVARARTGWELRPAAPELPEGPSAAELRAALEALPAAPEGDTQVHEDVQRAADRWRDAAASSQRHERREPAQAAPPLDAEPGELRALADTLDSEPPGVDEELAERMRALQAERNRRRARRGWGLGVAAVLAGLATAALVGGQGALAAGGAGVAVVAALAAVAVGRFAGDDELGDARAELAAQRRDAAKDAERRQRAEERAAELDVRAKPEALRELAGEVEQARALQQQHATWSAHRDELATELHDAEAELRRALAARGADVSAADDLAEALAAYRQACHDRAEQAHQAGRRDDLAARLAAREDSEQQAAQQQRQRRDAAAALIAAARRLASESADADGVAQALNGLDGGADADDAGGIQALDAAMAEWQHGHAQRRAQRSAHERDRARLASLLGGDTLDELRAAARRWSDAAQARHARLDADAGDLAGAGELDDAALATARQEAAQALETARQEEAEISGSLRHHEATLRPVAEAEEAHTRHAGEVERLRSLGAVLDVAGDHLRRASERINRDIAPALRHTVERWLPLLTAGRYHRVAVDPTTLEVTVDTPEGGWRPAARLSHGTSEQIYLLLRVALAEHLVTTSEPAPLLLDDPTAQSDDQRTEAILWLLRQLAEERQVVVFSQESSVRDWARTHLDGGTHRLVVLEPDAQQPGEELVGASGRDHAVGAASAG